MKDSTAYRWSQASLAKLNTSHPLLVTLFLRVIKRQDLPHDLKVVYGFRNKVEQDNMVKIGSSKLRWPNSKHNSVPAQAVDVIPFVNGQGDPKTWAYFHKHAPIVKDEWGRMVEEGLVPSGVTLTWGGDWVRFPDAAHWQVDGL